MMVDGVVLNFKLFVKMVEEEKPEVIMPTVSAAVVMMMMITTMTCSWL